MPSLALALALAIGCAGILLGERLPLGGIGSSEMLRFPQGLKILGDPGWLCVGVGLVSGLDADTVCQIACHHYPLNERKALDLRCLNSAVRVVSRVSTMVRGLSVTPSVHCSK